MFLGLASFHHRTTDEQKQDDDKQLMTETVRNLRDFLQAFEQSDIYDSIAPEKSQLRDDISRLLVLCTGALHSGVPSPSHADTMESAKAALIKSKGTFHAGLTMYPVCTFAALHPT